MVENKAVLECDDLLASGKKAEAPAMERAVKTAAVNFMVDDWMYDDVVSRIQDYARSWIL